MKRVKVLVTQSCPTLCDSIDCSPPGSFCPWNSLGKNTGVGCHFLLQGNLPDPGIKPGSPALQRFLTIIARKKSLHLERTHLVSFLTVMP